MQGRFIVTGLVALVVALPAGAASAAPCPGADTPVSADTVQSAAGAVLCIVNAERSARGLPTLTANDKLALAAQRHTDDMVARNFFDHFAPPPAPFGVDPGARITAAGYTWQAYGENIAVGQVTPREVMTSWIQSHGHCQNLLSPDFTQLGVGVAAGIPLLPELLGQTSGATWTQDFANPQGIVAPAASSAPQAGCLPNGYPALTGLDTAEQPPASSSSAAPSGSAPGSTTEQPGTVNVTTTPTTPPRLDVTLRHAGNALTVSGSLTPSKGKRSRVLITVRRRTHTLRRTRTRLNKRGRFTVRFTPVPGAGALTVHVSIGSLHVTRTVG